MQGSNSQFRARLLRVMQWAPSPWMMFVLSIWWAWRWAALPAGEAIAPMAVVAGFSHDVLVLYGAFGLLRGMQARERAVVTGSGSGEKLAYVLLAMSAVTRGLDALQVRLTDTRMTADLLGVLAADPVAELWGLRGVLLAVLLSAAAAMWAVRRDRMLWRRLRRMGAGQGHRLDVVGGAALLAGAMLAIGRGADPASAAPEVVCAQALWHFVSG